MNSTEPREAPPSLPPPAFIDDTPADNDAFGPHQKLAEGILSVIRQNAGGRTIGLVGDYGSGKSTVVRLLQQAVDDVNEIRVWVFDAWAHEGDPLRRTFLESLTHFLTGHAWARPANWTQALEALAMKHRTTKTTTKPKLAPLGVLLAFSLLLTPAGLAALAAALRGGIALQGTLDYGRLILGLIGGLFALAPAGVVLWGAIRAKGSKTWSEAADELASVVVQRGEQDFQAHSVETPDPTSLEFETHFTKLMGEALADADRRLVLVIDNLDRIEPPDAIRIWSTLRTFLDHSSDSASAPWLRRLWIVVPHDAQGIRRAWGEDARIADSMLDKSIQIRFDVPLPLLPDWKRYTMDLLATALPADEADHHSVYRLIAVLKPFRGHAPTPRILKGIINSIAALRLQFGRNIPLTHLAYYALQRMEAEHTSGDAILEQLLTGELPGRAEVGLMPTGVPESLAAVVFGVDTARARYLLLRPTVETALSDGDGAALAALSQRFTEAFPVVESILHESTVDWHPKEPEKILNALHALESSGLLDDAPEHEANVVRTNLLHALETVDGILPTGAALAGLGAMLRWPMAGEKADLLFEKYLAGLRAGIASEDLSRWADSYIASIKIFADSGHPQLAERQVMLPAAYQQFHKAVDALLTQGADRAVTERLGSTEDPASLTNDIKVVLATPATFTRSHAEAIAALVKNSPQVDVEGVAASFAKGLHAEAGAGADTIDVLLYGLQRLGQPGAEKIEQLGSNGHLAHLLNVVSGGDIAISARVVTAYVQVRPDLTLGRRTGQGLTGHQWLKQQLAGPREGLPEAIGRVLMGDSHPKYFFDAIEKADPDAVLLAKVVGIIAATQEYDEYFTPAFLNGHWATLRPHLDFVSLLVRVANAEFCAMLCNGAFRIEDGDFYAAVLDASSDTDLAEWMFAGLEEVDEAGWTSQLSSDSSAGCIIASALAPFRQARLGQPLRSALRSHAAGIANGAEPIACLSSLLDLLEPNHRSVFGDELAGLLQAKAGQPSASFFESFGPELTDAGRLNHDPSVAREVFENVATAGYLPGLRWMVEWIEAQDEPFQSLGTEHLSIIKDAVRDRYTASTADTEEGRLLKRIARKLNVRRKPLKR